MILSSFSLISLRSWPPRLEPPFLEKQSLQKTGLEEVGLNGTSHSELHEEQVTLVILGRPRPSLLPESRRSENLLGPSFLPESRGGLESLLPFLFSLERSNLGIIF